jgi:hypothetical protein
MLSLAAVLLLAAQGPAPYERQADWESYASGVTTGGAFADIDGDGHLDMVVANGNDISRQRVEVYYGDGQGNLPTNPQWQSGDVDYHGHLTVGDVDGDGWPDVAVSVFLGASGFGDLGHVKLYRNLGGMLESTPSWRSSDEFYSFGCAFGDADSDGDLDLAVAVGEPYFGAPAKNRIYFNRGGGVLETTPSWQAATADHAMDAMWGDLDGNGQLDLAFVTAGRHNTVYFQAGGVLATTPGWTSSDNGNQNGNNGAIADYDGDGDLDLCVSDNDQLSGGQGLFKIYRNGPGGLATQPTWSDFQGYVSAVAFGDVLLDGSPDLFGGAWWGGTYLYLNDAGSLPNSPEWDSQLNSVVEALFLGDMDEAGVVEDQAVFAGDGVTTLFRLPHAPLQALDRVEVDGVELGPDDYCWDREGGWISCAVAPLASVVVDFRWSTSLDLGVTNWDGGIGNLLFLRAPLVEVAMTPPSGGVFSGGDTISFSGSFSSTTARPESVALAAAAFPPSGGMRVLAFQPTTLAPFATQALPVSVTLPPNLPPAFLGQTTLTVAAVVDGQPIDRADTVITIQ